MTDQLLAKIVDQLFGVHIALAVTLAVIAGLLGYIACYITLTTRRGNKQ